MRIGTPIGQAVEALDGGWVDRFLLTGPEHDVCLHLDAPITRGALLADVDRRTSELRAAGLGQGGTIALRLPPSMTYVVNLLSAWRVGAQVSLLDHRLTDHEVERALERIKPQLVVSTPGQDAVGRHQQAPPAITVPFDGQPAASPHVLFQLSSGSTGPSKVIGRTAADLCGEVLRYQQIDGTPLPGERVVLLSSMVHVLGLVGGLLFCLHSGVQLVVPRALSTQAILAAIAGGQEPTAVIGVPFHIEYLNVGQPAVLPQLKRMTVGGELVRPLARQSFRKRYRVPLGVMYGMTEAGVIATDLHGEHWPQLTPAPGMSLREEAGQLLLAMPSSPYVGLIDPTRWVDGWLHTRDAGSVDPASGRVTIRGRLDSQVSVGGLKVDLTEVEQTLAELPGVTEVVVAYDGVIEAFAVLADPHTATEFKQAIAQRLAPYKRPRRVHLLDRLPRTATGKLVRNLPQLRQVPSQARHSNVNERSGADV
jgi:3-hydroxy-4-methylanthranilate adenylyltransferase